MPLNPYLSRLTDTGASGDEVQADAGDHFLADCLADQLIMEVAETQGDTGGFDFTDILNPIQMTSKLITGGYAPQQAQKLAVMLPQKVAAKIEAAKPGGAARPPMLLGPSAPKTTLAAPRPAAVAHPNLKGAFPLSMVVNAQKAAGNFNTPQQKLQAQKEDEDDMKPKILSNEELMSRCTIVQVAAYDGIILAGATTDVEVKVTIDGTVFTWSVCDAADDLVVKKVSYAQRTTTVFNPQSLGAWSNKAAHRVAVEPISVRMPNVFAAQLYNPTADPIYVAWTMMGLADIDVGAAIQDPDVAHTLRMKKIALSQMFQAGQLGS